MIVDEGHAAAGLDQGPSLLLRLYYRAGVVFVNRKTPEVGDGFFEVDIFSRGPEGEDLLPLPKKFFIRPAVII
jgi:hypothetical protein